MPKKLTDPKVHALAELFVDDTMNDVVKPVSATKRKALVDRAAAAMQQAIEDECEEIRRELSA